MRLELRKCQALAFATALLGASWSGLATAQGVAVAAVKTQAPAAAATPEEVGATQEKLLERLRMSPNLSAVVAGDPTLLSNQEYVSRNNPQLAQFLLEHPEVVRNPGFYLFSDLRQPGQRSYEVMVPRQGFEPPYHREDRSETEMLIKEAEPFLAIVLIGGALLWLIRLLLENRRWGRVFKMQSEVHGKLIDKLGSSQELLTYMDTDAGRRFLEAAPITTEVQSQRVPNVVSRVLTALQVGVVMMLLGAGLLMVRHSLDEGQNALLVLGIVILMPGIGFTISAAITWVLAGKLGLMPAADTAASSSLTERL